MKESLRAGIARIDVMQQERSVSRGTGFLVADGLVLTALHVVADRTQESLAPYPGEIVLTFPTHTTKAVVHDTHFDRKADWVLLHCESTPPIRALPLAELRDDGAEWEAFGFPDANPRDGMVNIGAVSNRLATLDGNAVFQLFSQEAAAGLGAPVKGLSGAPVIVNDAVVGLLRFALMTKEQQTVAGTLYACPIASVLPKASALLPTPDPCFGLPGLPPQPLPTEPFRNLAWFTSSEAEVFFGRNRDIRELYERLTADDAPRVTLLYGQGSVGKSSFLNAGMAPRLRWYHDVQYVRRDSGSSLLQTLCKTLRQAGGADGALSDWRAIEEKTGKPLLVFFDQIGQALSTPSAQHPEELDELTGALKTLFEGPPGGPMPPRGRIVLSFRKEWFPEIQQAMDAHGLSFGKVFLEGLDREAIVDVVTGLTTTDRLRQCYGLTIEERLPGFIADDLLADQDSPIAPTLQVLLTKMWDKAVAANRSAPEMTVALYQHLKEEGLLLGDFLDQQIAALKGTHAEAVESGLVLDVLDFHTTPLLTVKERSRADLLANYRHRQEVIPELSQAMQALFLLSDTAADTERQATRLSHDALAPLVRRRFQQSEKPGQRARRILENRMEDWTEGSETGLLDARSLPVVLGGVAGMRVPTAREEQLIAASRLQQRKRQRNQTLLRASALVAVLLVLTFAVTAGLQSRRATRERNIAQLRYTTAEIAQLLQNNPPNALLVAIRAVGWSQRVRGSVSSEVTTNLATAMAGVRERLVLPWSMSAAISADGVIAMAGSNLEFVDGTSGKQIDSVESSELQVTCGGPACVTVSPNGKLVSLAGPGGVLLWTRDAHRGRVLFPEQDVVATAFAPLSDKLIAVTRTGAIRQATVTGEQNATYQIAGLRGARIRLAAIAYQSANEGYVVAIAADPAGGADRVIYLGDLKGKLLARPFVGHRHSITSIAVNAARELTVASGDAEGNLLLWDRNGALTTDQNHLHAGPISTLAFNPQGDLVASAGRDDKINFTSPNGRPAETPARGFGTEITALAFSPDGDRLVAVSGTQTKLLDTYGLRTRAPLDTRTVFGKNAYPIVTGELSGVTVGSQHAVAIGTTRGYAILWHPPTGYVRKIESTNGASIIRMVFSADEKILVIGSADGTLRVLDRTGNSVGEAVWPVVAEGNGASGAFSFDLERSGKFLVTADDGGLRLWDTQTHRELHAIKDKESSETKSVQFMSDGIRFVTSTADMLRFWTIRSGKIERAALPDIPLDAGFAALGFSRDDSTFAAGNGSGQIRLFRANGTPVGEAINPHDSDRPVLGAVAFPDGLTTASFVLYGENVTYCAFSAESCVPTSIAAHQGSITAITLSPDGKTLATVGGDGIVRLMRAHWTTWLAAACDRLRNHPVLQETDTSNDLGDQTSRRAGTAEEQRVNRAEAKQTCQAMARVFN